MASSISSRLWRALPPLLTTTAISATVAAAVAAAAATRSALASASASLAAARTRGGAALTRSAAAVAGASAVAVRGVVPPLAASTAAAAVTPSAVAAVRAGGPAPATARWAAVAAAAVGEAAAAAIGGAAATAAIVAVLGVAGRGQVDGIRRGAGAGRAEAGVLLSRLRDRLAGGGAGGGAWLVTTAVGVAAEVLATGPLAPGGGGLGGRVTTADLTDLVAAVGGGVAAALHTAGGWDVLLAEPAIAARGLGGEPAEGADAGLPGALEDHPQVHDPPWGGSVVDMAAATGASPVAVAALAAEAADVLDLALPLAGAPGAGLPAAGAALVAAARVDRFHPGLADGGSLPLAKALPALARAGPALLARLASAEDGGGVVEGDTPLGTLLDGPDLRRVFAAAFLSGERWPGDGG